MKLVLVLLTIPLAWAMPSIKLRSLHVEPARNDSQISPRIMDRQACPQIACSRRTTLGKGDTYEINSPNYPSCYGPSSSDSGCHRLLVVEPNVRVEVTCQAFNVRCPDTLVLSIDHQNVLQRCGTSLNGATITGFPVYTSDTYELRFLFFMTAGSSAPGFSCTVVGIGTDTPTVPPTMPSTTAPPAPTCDCGTTSVNDRIVNGQDATINEYPWMVALTRRPDSQFIYNTFCGGTLVDRCHVLTAAHCMLIPASEMQVILGDHREFDNDSGERRINVASIINHPDYVRTSNGILINDFAILRLETCLSGFNQRERPACLPRDNSNQFVSTTVTATGWGDTTEGGSGSAVLQETTLSTISNQACNGVYGAIQSNMICAIRSGTDTCQGDSGGPLTALVNGRHTLVGVTSFGDGCARPGIPGVYARVSTALDFLRQNGVNPCTP